MKTLTILSMLPVAVVTTQADTYAHPDQFCRSSACKAFAESDREKSESETRDTTLRQGALDRDAGVSLRGEARETSDEI